MATHFIRFGLISLISLGLFGCAVQSSNDVIKREANSGGFMGLTNKAPVEASGSEAIKGAQKIIIGSFKVGFIESTSAKRTAGGGLTGGSSGNASGRMLLTGTSPAMLQEITNTAYQDFLTQLTKAGFTIVDHQQFTNSKQYGDMTKYEFPYTLDISGWLSSYGVSKFYQPTGFGRQGIVFDREIQGFKSGFNFNSASNKAVQFAKANNLPVVSATYVIDFVTAEGKGGSWATSANLKVGQNLAVTSGKVIFMKNETSSFSNGTASFGLGQPVEAGEAFATIETTTSGAMVGVQTGVNLLVGLAGGGTNLSKDFEVKADPIAYQRLSTKILGEANAILVGESSKYR